MSTVKIIFCFVIVSCLYGVKVMYYAVQHSDTVFQQIAGMVEGLCYVIVPYCIAKAFEVIKPTLWDIKENDKEKANRLESEKQILTEKE